MSEAQSTPDPPVAGRCAARDLTWVGLLVALLVCLVAPSVVDVLLHATSTGDFPDLRAVAALVASTAVEVIVVVWVISWLRWWPLVLHEHLRVRSWLWALPGVLLVASIAVIDYVQLVSAGPALTMGLLVGCLLIGAGEELLFRGVVLTFARGRYREWLAALVTTVLFAAFHLPGGILVAAGAGLTGALLYVVRRVSGGILVPILVHGVWDFAVYSGHLGADADPSSTPSQVLFLLSVGLVLIVAFTHRWWRVVSPPPS